MDKRAFIVIIICFVILFGWQTLVNHLWPPPPPGMEPKPPGAPTNVVEKAAPAAEVKPVAPVEPPKPAEPPKPRPPEQTVTLENDLVRAVLTSYGGGVKDVLLKKWTISLDDPELVTLNLFGPEPVLALADWPGADSNAVYSVQQISPTNAVVTCDAAGGLRVVKEFRLTGDYVIGCRVRFENAGKQPQQTPAFGVALGTAAQLHALDDVTYVSLDFWDGGPLTMTGRAKVSYNAASSLASRELAATNTVRWAAVNNCYFAMVLTPSEPAAGVRGQKFDLPLSLTPKATAPAPGARGWLRLDAVKVEAGATVTREFKLYAGPKEFKRLVALGDHQEEVMNFGMFGRISEALLWGLTTLHSIGFNYGIAIIVLTVIIKLLFWPIQAISTRSMKKMQALQPHLAKLKEKYPDDPQKQQQEMMKLYREHKINPMSGCLPLLVQIPVFMGLYWMLRTAVELRGARFLWIRDLSQPDTILKLGDSAFLQLNPLPLIMCATTIWQQKLTPQTSADPTQQRMMMLMPVMFLFMFYTVSSGLLLYWTVQNLLSILQQWLALRDQQKTAVPAAPAKR
ncbi:MAG: membrane protein insertase YidC [Verrucomicrobia bacterium]|nr:membrane protein insertase YidC [Verrucomicrobiota bacterium]